MNKNMLTDSEYRRYARHISLPEFGERGQECLKRSKVLVVGAGGLGCPALLYLAAAGVGTLGVVDSDKVSESNLQRQILYGVSSIGSEKVYEIKQRLTELNPHVNVDLYCERLSVSNVEKIISPYDVIIDGSDNFSTRYLVNDACVVLKKGFISGALSKFTAQVGVFNLGGTGPTYRCLFPTPPLPEDAPNCEESGVLGVLPGLVGVIQATEAIKILTGIGEPLSGRILIIDSLKMNFKTVSLKRSEEVVERTKFEASEAYLNLCKERDMAEVKEMTPTELKGKLDKGEKVMVLDVREPFEKDICNIGGELIPLKELSSRAAALPRDREIVVHCRSGGRSKKACEELQERFGFSNVYNLQGGILRWIDEIDSSLKRY